jgi:hypothetical protein
VDPVSDPVVLRKSGSAGNRDRDLWVRSQKLWLLDHTGGLHILIFMKKYVIIINYHLFISMHEIKPNVRQKTDSLMPSPHCSELRDVHLEMSSMNTACIWQQSSQHLTISFILWFKVPYFVYEFILKATVSVSHCLDYYNIPLPCLE